MNVSQGEVYLVPAFFSNMIDKKVRPVVIVSKNSFNENSKDIIACGLTTNIKNNLYSLLINKSDFSEGILYDPCCVKSESLLRLKKKMLIKKICVLKESFIKRVIKQINSLFV